MSYAGVVMFDQPVNYWELNDVEAVNETFPQGAATAGTHALLPSAGVPAAGSSAIVGYATKHGSVALDSTDTLVSETGAGDVSGLAVFTAEAWFKAADITPAGTRTPIRGPLSGANAQWRFDLNTGGTISAIARNSGGTNHTVTSATLANNTWYYIAVTLDSATLRLYVNGAQVASTAWTGTFGTMDAGSTMLITGSGVVAQSFFIDELAVYRYALPAARVAAHYEAGALRGFPWGQVSGARVTAILDSVESHAPRRIDTGSRAMVGRFMNGQDPLGELRTCERAEGPDGLLFVGRDGAIVFLDGDHRASAPYDTVQATFDDDATDLPYESLEPDYSDSFLFNDFNGTRVGGDLLSASDQASIDEFGKRSHPAVTDLPVTNDADAQDILDAQLAKYKQPLDRILSLDLTTAHPDVTEAAFRLDLGDRIRIIRRPPGGGTPIDQTSFVTSIRITASNDQAPWRIQLGVSPL